MKLKLHKIQKYLAVEFRGTRTLFEQHEGATEFALKQWKRYYKEQSAYAMLGTLSVNLLNTEELDLYNKLCKNKCRGITKAQYGYVKGIHERQEREW